MLVDTKFTNHKILSFKKKTQAKLRKHKNLSTEQDVSTKH